MEEKLDQIALQYLGPNFKFRKGQKETIIQICEAYFDESITTVILSANTGTGKSVIAMLSSLLLESYHKTGYIIASDIALQEQYESDINKYKLKIKF